MNERFTNLGNSIIERIGKTVDKAVSKAEEFTSGVAMIKKESLEISRMLTLSTGHLTEETRKLIEADGVDITVYLKGRYGWFICVPKNEDTIEALNTLPADLKKAIQVAHNNGCEWICFDVDGPEVDGLEYYDD